MRIENGASAFRFRVRARIHVGDARSDVGDRSVGWMGERKWCRFNVSWTSRGARQIFGRIKRSSDGEMKCIDEAYEKKKA